MKYVLLVALVIAISGCAASTPVEPQTIEIVMDEFTYTPSELDIKGGDVTFIIKNEGQIEHELLIYKKGDPTSPLAEARNIGAGETRELTVHLPKGEYEIGCHIPGHYESGMKGDLNIQNDATGSSGHSSHGTKAKEVLSVEEMDAKRKAHFSQYPAETEGKGGKKLSYKMVDGYKVFELTAKKIQWEVTPGNIVESYAYNGQIPGPEIRVHKGDMVRIVVTNELEESTTVHFHGVQVPLAMDGVPFISQDPIKPGETFTYEFEVVEESGTYEYHAHYNTLEQVDKGLFGVFIVEYPEEEKTWTKEYTMVVGDGNAGYTLNGKGFPATEPIVVNQGEKLLIRYLNSGQQIHPMHLHGFHFEVISKDGRKLASPYEADTLLVTSGERYDVVVTPNLKGTWLLHCHVLSHVDGPRGLHGMITALVVQ